MPQSTSTDINTNKLRVNLVSETPFTVQGHGVHTAFIESKNALLKIGVEVKMNSNERCDIAHIHTVGPYSLIKVLKNKKRTVITAHVVPDSFVGSLIFAKLWSPLAKIYLRFFYNRASAIIAVSPEVKKELKKMKVKRKIYVVPNIVNLERFKKDNLKRQKMRKKLNIKENDFVALNSGQIQPRKGIKTFINTAKNLPSIKFVWVGGIPFKRFAANYKEMGKIQKEAPSNVIFTGTVPFEDMPYYYNAADILFFPSLQETFGFAVIEAGAIKRPLLMRGLDIYEPIFGESFIKGDEKSFAKYILRLKEDKSFYNEYSEKSYKTAKKYEDIKIAKILVTIYKKILEKRNGKK